MPFTLPRLSRREFLRRAALAAAATALAPPCYAGLVGKSPDPHTFAFLSDAHIAGDAKLFRGGINMTDNLAACVNQMTAWPVVPGAIICNGDLAFTYGKADDYANFGRIIQPLRLLAPIHLSLGNHDNRENFQAAFPQDVASIPGVPARQAAFFPSEFANWFLLDSLDVTAETPGYLGRNQLKWLSRELSARPDKPAIIVCHHPIDPIGWLGLRDSSALEDIFTRQPQVKAFIFGHTHDWHTEEHPSGVHLINLPQTAYPFVTGRPSGWVRATIAQNGAEFELRCLDLHHPEHGQIKSMTWRS